MGPHRATMDQCCICMRGKWSCRFTKIARRSTSSLPSPRICARRLLNAAGATTKLLPPSVTWYPLVQRLLDPLRLGAVVLGATDLAAAYFSENGAGAGPGWCDPHAVPDPTVSSARWLWCTDKTHAP